MSPELSGGQLAGAGQAPDKVAGYALCLGDDALIMAQRLGEWIASAPQLEEDVALANVALDQLGQARSLLGYAGSLMEPPRSEDDLAYFRDERDFRNVQLVERSWALPGGTGSDFGVTMARLLIWSTYQVELYSRLAAGTDETLAAVAAKAVKEVDYHRDHATMWVLRLGDGTAESHARMQAGLDAEWAYAAELFDPSYVDPELVESGVAVDPTLLREPCERRLDEVIAEATLTRPEARPATGGGRQGIHTEQMGYLLAEMQHLARSHPGASW
jgi:ring-1,2-phenylacetyl-CoA epoxidase subunit PaaC